MNRSPGQETTARRADQVIWKGLVLWTRQKAKGEFPVYLMPAQSQVSANDHAQRCEVDAPGLGHSGWLRYYTACVQTPRTARPSHPRQREREEREEATDLRNSSNKPDIGNPIDSHLPYWHSHFSFRTKLLPIHNGHLNTHPDMLSFSLPSLASSLSGLDLKPSFLIPVELGGRPASSRCPLSHSWRPWPVGGLLTC